MGSDIIRLSTRLAIFDCLDETPRDALDITIKAHDKHGIHVPMYEMNSFLMAMLDSNDIKGKASTEVIIGTHMFWR